MNDSTNQQEEILAPVQVEAGEIVYQQDKAMIDMQIATAKAYPRNIQRAVDNSIATVSLDKETAQSCHYALPRGGKQISGPSVHLAKIVAQNWGNLRVEAKVIEIGKTQITSQAVCFDLENNIAMKVEVKRSIMTRNGRMNDDMITVTGNAANAIALRNAIYAVVPKGVIDKVYNAAKHMIAGDLSDEQKLKAKRKTVIDALKGSYNVTEEEILRAIGRQSVNHITAEDIINLIGIGQAIKDGDTSVDEAFRSKAKKEQVNAEDKEFARVKGFIESVKNEEDLITGCGEYVDGLPAESELKKLYADKLAELQKQEPSK